jgi:hypothetical protein
MKKPVALLIAIALGAALAAKDRAITASEGSHTTGSGNMPSTAAPHADAAVDATSRGGFTIGSGN